MTMDRLAAAVAEAMRDPAVQKHITDMNIEPVVGTRAQMAAVILEEIERWKPEVESARSK